MVALIPPATTARVLKSPVVEMVAQNRIHITQRQRLAGPGDELNLPQPFVELPSAPAAIRNLGKYFFNDRCAVGVDVDFSFLMHVFAVQISGWCNGGPEAHLALGLEPALYVDALVIVLEFRLTPQDHEQELFIRIVSESLAMRADLYQPLLV